MMAEETTEGVAGSRTGSILTRKTGPLANWIWMAILLLVALVYSMWRKNREAANANTDDTADSSISSNLDNQTPPPVFILPQNPQPTVPVNVTVNNPVTPPDAPPIGNKPPATNPPPAANPPPKPADPGHFKVTVAKYTSKNPPWNSTLWGIAEHAGRGKAANNWNDIWNDPRNAALKQKRGTPTKIQPGDVVWVKRR